MRRLPLARKGISLIEVTFAIGVVTVGLLGVIALLPLAAHQARQGDIVDRSAVLGLSALEEFDMRGYRRPDMWLTWTPIPGRSEFTPFRPGPGLHRWSVFNPATSSFVGMDSLNGSTALAAPPYSNPGAVEGGMVQAFCIDPRFLSANLPNMIATGGAVTPRARYFPYYPPNYPVAAGGLVPRMTRITVKAFPTPRTRPDLSQALSVSQAERIFVSDDDLAVEFPEDDGQPSFVQGFNEGPDGGWGIAGVDDNANTIIDDIGEAGTAGSDDTLVRRLAKGEYSWMATLAPKLDLTGVNRVRDEYTLSIVIFHLRDSSMTIDEQNENVANVILQSGGFGGGEVTLEAVDTDQGDQVLGGVRPNNWVMLSADSFAGPHFRWYRVSSADGDQSRLPSSLAYNSGNPVWQRRVTLEGPDWTRPEWQGLTPPFRTQATIVSGVVAVYEKTVRLESTSLWNQ